MNIGKRNSSKILGALFKTRHYKAFLKSFMVYEKPFTYLRNYLFAKGTYPSTVVLKNKFKTIAPTLYSHHDLLTVNEIFCREDYRANNSIKTIVDIGANIGISALYFLTKNNDSFVYLYEPNPTNVTRLKNNLENFKGRFHIEEVAVSNEEGILEFGVEDTGRYGGLHVQTGKTIKVKCIHIDTILESILKNRTKIDILKLDTEGAEINIINGIRQEYLDKIDTIYLEIDDHDRIQTINPNILKHYHITHQGPIYKFLKR